MNILAGGNCLSPFPPNSFNGAGGARAARPHLFPGDENGAELLHSIRLNRPWKRRPDVRLRPALFLVIGTVGRPFGIRAADGLDIVGAAFDCTSSMLRQYSSGITKLLR